MTPSCGPPLWFFVSPFFLFFIGMILCAIFNALSGNRGGSFSGSGSSSSGGSSSFDDDDFSSGGGDSGGGGASGSW